MNRIKNILKIKEQDIKVIVTLGLLVVMISNTIFTGYNAKSAEASTFVNKWHPGIYVKVEGWQLDNPTQLEAIYNELKTTPQLRGIKVSLMWGEHEVKNQETGEISYDFSKFDNILERLATLDNKHLIISFPWREFQNASGADNLLPNDLRGGVLWNEDPAWEHIDYDYLWAYKMSNATGSYGYNLKLWDPVITTRLDYFFQALSEHLDNHPNLTQISTTESAIGSPVIPFLDGEGRDTQYAGQLMVLRMLKKHFTNTIILANLNYDRPFVAEAVPVLLSERIGFGSPNSNLSTALTTTNNPPGVMNYYPTLSGKLVLSPEIQGDDYKSTYGAGTAIDYPAYDYLYNRAKNSLNANYLVIQRTFPYWLGGTVKGTTTTVPSMLQFIKTYPDIVNDPTGAGGLDHVKPSMLDSDVTPPILPGPDLSFNASATEVYSGDSAVLSWSATNSTACEASGSWSGTKSIEGNESINNITSPSTYSLTCIGAGGSVTKEVLVGIKADTVPPSIPNNLSYINVSTDSVTLNWSVATDNIAVTGYNLYRDGVKINTLTDTTFTDSSLTSGSSYTYTITALDGAGNESEHSTSVNVTTIVVVPFEIYSYSATNLTRNSATINASLSKIGDVTVKYGRISSNLNLTKISANIKIGHSVVLSSLDRDRVYYYQIIAKDQSGKTITSPVASFKTRK